MNDQAMSGKILIIEDYEESAEILKDHLESKGYQVSVAGDGESGLAAVGSYTPDVVLLDIMLPRIDGWEVLERLRKDDDTKKLPVIFMSAYHSLQDDQDRKRAEKLGCSSFLRKPLDLEELLASIQSNLG